MKRSTLLRWHRWLAVPLGLALVTWLVSGLMFLIPNPTPNVLLPYEPPSTDWTDAATSPARAIETARAIGSIGDVLSVTVEGFDSTPVYRIRGSEGVVLVNAISGEQLLIDEAWAVRLASERVRQEVTVAATELVSAHSLMYPSGPLPAYRVRFQSDDDSWGYVGIDTGEVYYSSRDTRIKAAIVSLHDFGALRVVAGANANQALMWLASLGLILVTLTGYILAWKWLAPARARRGSA